MNQATLVQTIQALRTFAAWLLLTLAVAADWTEVTFGDQPVAIGAGARALGMGGAFTAVADDATASTWNPAGLVQCERPEMSLSLGAYRTTIIDDDAHNDHNAVQPDHISAMLPFFAGGCQQVVGVSWQRQYDYTREFTVRQASSVDAGFFILSSDDRDHITKDGSLASLGISYAIEPSPGFAIGLTANVWGDRWTGASHYRERSQRVARTTLTFPGPVDFTQIDTFLGDDQTRVASGWNVVGGCWWQATPALTVALTVKPGYRLHLETSSTLQHSVDDGMTITTTDTVTGSDVDLRHPPSATLGLAWRQADLHTVACDVTWTRWRNYAIEDSEGRHSPIFRLAEPDEFPDLWSVRFGYEYVAILPQVVLVPRIGALVEWLPAVTAAPSLYAVDQAAVTRDRWIGLTAGLGVCQRDTVWDFAIQVRRGVGVGAGQFTVSDQTADVTIITARLGVAQSF
ncbi:MAG: outer membrane protein transport protein [Planctomycetota bacterium]